MVSLFDVDLETKATFNGREFVSGGTDHFINKNEANTFSGKMTFSKKLEVSRALTASGSITSTNENVKLNDKVVKTFDSDIVKKSNSYTGTIETPVTMSARISVATNINPRKPLITYSKNL